MYLLKSPVQVRIRSPTPESPAKVRGLAPHFTAGNHSHVSRRQSAHINEFHISYLLILTARPVLQFHWDSLRSLRVHDRAMIKNVEPLVMSAARALNPNPSPSEIPHAIASTFFNAPPNSTPTVSSVV